MGLNSFLVVLFLFFGFVFCAAGPQPDFYRGLLSAAESASATADSAETAARPTGAGAYFEKALGSSNPYVRKAAAEELLKLLYRGEAVSPRVYARLKREAPPSWAAAFDVLAAPPEETRERALAFLLGPPAGARTENGVRITGSAGGDPFPGEAALYVLRECRERGPGLFSPAESAALDGYIAASRSRYAEALESFRVCLAAGPALFFQYPNLLNDLGRCFQYTDSGEEGLDLFLGWEKELAENPGKIPGETSPEAPSLFSAEGRFAAEVSNIRFRLLFFAARMARQRGRLDRGIELFTRARPFAPDPVQEDACIWYILDSTLTRSPGRAAQQAALYIPQWNNDLYFSDILDNLARLLTAGRQWGDLVRIFALIKNRSDGASTAKYAYIIGRALEEGFLSPEESAGARAAAGTEGGADSPAAAFLRAAREAEKSALYYHALSAAALGEPFPELPEAGKAPAGDRASAASGSGREKPALRFLLDFFRYGAAGFAEPYIRALEDELTGEDLRVLAESLAGAGLYAESIRLISSYLERDDIEPGRRDLELYYPRPFRETVEKYAKETGLAPELLFGLIRTESAFQSGIVSRAGAVGLTQLMPATAEETAGRIRRNSPDRGAGLSAGEEGNLNLFDPETNIRIGAVYLGYLIDRMESPLLALLAYNGGMNRVRRWREADRQAAGRGMELPGDLFLETIEYPETRNYGRKVLAAALLYGCLYYDLSLAGSFADIYR
ncbi:MAG: transglycosylase SLT domain-containing protein [Treponema sp.]|nr:transglycosylase SLT domain-containing protein [Treponema sp.]